MPIFSDWDIVKVPFPYTDRPVRQRRPALVVATGGALAEHGLLWVLMITSAENSGWPGDIEVTDFTKAGLPAASVVRTAKIATIEAREAERIGSLPAKERVQVAASLQDLLPLIATAS